MGIELQEPQHAKVASSISAITATTADPTDCQGERTRTRMRVSVDAPQLVPHLMPVVEEFEPVSEFICFDKESLDTNGSTLTDCHR